MSCVIHVDGILLLRGWHPDLAYAESLALWPDQEIERIEGPGRFLRVRNLPEQAAHRAFLAAGIEGVLCHGALSPVDVEAIHHIAESCQRDRVLWLCAFGTMAFGRVVCRTSSGNVSGPISSSVDIPLTSMNLIMSSGW